MHAEIKKGIRMYSAEDMKVIDEKRKDAMEQTTRLDNK